MATKFAGFAGQGADDGPVIFFGQCRLTFVSENGGADECAEAESLGDVAVVGGDRGQAEATRHFNEAGPLVGGAAAICAVLFRKNASGGTLNVAGFLPTHHIGLGDGANIVAEQSFYARPKEPR